MTASRSNGGHPLASLRRFRDPAPVRRVEEKCEMCAKPVSPEHSHIVNLESRSLLCTCRPCALLFTHPGAAQGKYRAVPDRYLHAPSFRLTEAQWEQLQIPVKMAFFFFNSSLKRFVAFYPSPAGATESLLGLEAWQELSETHPLVPILEPDVEALLVYGRRTGEFDCFLVPIHECYQLVGRVKLHWKGFHGGEEAWQEIEAFFAGVREKSRPLEGSTA